MTPDSRNLADIVEHAVLADRGELFWPLLSCLERLDVAVATLPQRKREAVRTELSDLRMTLLFDLRALAVSLAGAVERQIAVEAISRAQP